MRRLLLAAALVAVSGGAAHAGASMLLDEYNLEVYRGPDTARLAAGLTFGDVYGNGWWWFWGGRASWSQYLDDGPRIRAIGLGGTVGVGYHPERLVSPVAGLSLEKTFGTDSRIDAQSQVYVGARLRVTSDPTEYYAFTFAVYQQKVYAGSRFRDQNDTGIAILYSASRYAPR